MHERLNQWLRQAAFPESRLAPLGFAAEMWQPPETHPAYPTLIATASRRGLRVSPWYDLTGGVLEEVIYAAGGIEYGFAELEATMSSVQDWADVHVVPTLAEGPQPELGTGVSHPALIGAWYQFANILAWARALDDRLVRPSDGGRGSSVGLIPLLARRSRLAIRTTDLRRQLLKGRFGEAGYLANYALHVGMVGRPTSGASVAAAGRVLLPIPDQLTGRVDIPFQFTYDQGRDALSWSRALLSDTASFMDGLLTAFHDESPDRMKTPASAPSDIDPDV